jgi:VCBS repeat protein
VLKRPSDSPSAAVAHMTWQPPSDVAPGRLVFSDMHVGEVYEIELPAENLTAKPLAHLGHPAIVEPADFDADGVDDYLVGDLGTFLPEDHDLGRALWLHPHPQRGWVADALATGLGRVAHVASGDFDGDKDLDVLVAAFGWRKTGRILLLRRSDDESGKPKYEEEVVDPRHGPSHVLPIDWDRDGDLDFVALISQEHEKVELFRNDGAGNFRPETIFAAGDPGYGSSGIELIDFDDDGDMDVLLTNGDSMDSRTLKPSHGVRWLENKGDPPFTAHLLTNLPGAFKAVAGDIDGDGDRDVIVIAFPPMGTAPSTWPSTDLLVVLEQTTPGQFARHVLPEKIGGTAMTAGDFDGDGDLDLATGAFHQGGDGTWVTVWWNEGK